MEYKLLLSSDGSDNAIRAAEFAAELVAVAPAIKITVLVVNDILEKMKYYSPLRSPVVPAWIFGSPVRQAHLNDFSAPLQGRGWGRGHTPHQNCRFRYLEW